MSKNYNADVLIIGAGPSGAIAASLLCQEGLSVRVFEREEFPRFSIGESLLPQSMAFIEKSGALDKVLEAGFQLKNGAAFQCGGKYSAIDFSDQFTPGWNKTLQVERSRFDKILADHAEDSGAKIHYKHTIEDYTEDDQGVCLKLLDEEGQAHEARGKFVLDASGYGRVLPKLLGLEKPSNFPARKAIFTHIQDNIEHPEFDRQKILITIHKDNPNIWHWLIPFPNGKSSIGVVGRIEEIDSFGQDDEQRLKTLIAADSHYQKVMPDLEFTHPIRSMKGYSCKVTNLYGKHYALLGNAGEFLDPVFSSGVTIAFKSADLAVSLLSRQFKGEKVDWEKEYSDALMVGVNAFRSFVEAWYEGSLQTVMLNIPTGENEFRKMIISLLAGFAWDETNPFVKKGDRLLPIIAKECA